MLQSILTVIFLLFVEIKHSHLSSSKEDLSWSGDTVFRLDKHQEFAQELQSEQLFFSNAGGGDSSQDWLEGSGDDSKERKVLDTRDSGCLETVDSGICSNKGKCVDSKCICDSLLFDIDNATLYYRYSGKYCEECPYCRAQRCSLFLPCIECNLLEKNANCSSYCQFGYYENVDKVVRNIDNDEKFCDVENANGCFFKFKYYYNTHNTVFVQYESDYDCFNGLRIVIFTFWGVVAYILVLSLVVPRIYCVSGRNEVSKSRTSLSTGHDVLRFNPYR